MRSSTRPCPPDAAHGGLHNWLPVMFHHIDSDAGFTNVRIMPKCASPLHRQGQDQPTSHWCDGTCIESPSCEGVAARGQDDVCVESTLNTWLALYALFRQQGQPPGDTGKKRITGLSRYEQNSEHWICSLPAF